MRRRQFIAVVGASVVAGCGGEIETENNSQPTDSPTPSPTPTPESNKISNSEQAFSELSNATAGHGVEIIFTDIGSERGAYIEYVDGGKSREQRMNDIENITKSYLDLVERGWNSDWLEAALMESNGSTVIFSWLLEPAWVEQYLQNELTAQEVANRAKDTVL